MSEPNKKIEMTFAQPSKSSEMIKTLLIISLVCGFLIVAAFQITLPAIKKNKARVLKQAVLEVIPGAKKSAAFKVDENGMLIPLVGEDEKAKKFHTGYSESGNLQGIAIEARGQGFQEIVKVIYGYSPSKQSVIGMKVLESKETPGLGDKIEKDPQFRANFEDLDVSLTPNGTELVHEIEIVKKGKKTEKWQIDTITGATISSKAIGRMMKKSTAEVIPLVNRNLSKVKVMPAEVSDEVK